MIWTVMCYSIRLQYMRYSDMSTVSLVQYHVQSSATVFTLGHLFLIRRLSTQGMELFIGALPTDRHHRISVRRCLPLLPNLSTTAPPNQSPQPAQLGRICSCDPWSWATPAPRAPLSRLPHRRRPTPAEQVNLRPFREEPKHRRIRAPTVPYSMKLWGDVFLLFIFPLQLQIIEIADPYYPTWGFFLLRESEHVMFHFIFRGSV
jgi:hypothetical protein